MADVNKVEVAEAAARAAAREIFMQTLVAPMTANLRGSIEELRAKNMPGGNHIIAVAEDFVEYLGAFK